MIERPGNAAIGVWQPGTQKGFEIHGTSPGAAAWFELHTREYALDRTSTDVFDGTRTR